MSAQFYSAAVQANQSIENEMQKGEFNSLRNWLQLNLHHYGKKFTGLEALKKATGEDLNINYYVNYLKKKFS